MEVWILYALIAALWGWLFNFWLKIVAERDYDVNYVSFLVYLVMTFLAWVVFFSQNTLEDSLTWFMIMLSLWIVARTCFFLSTITRVQWLKYIDTTIFFPLYKTFFPIMAVIGGVVIFSEPLALKEILWICIGISVPLLLITKRENAIQKNIKYWLIFILLTSVCIFISTIAYKYIITANYNLDFYIFISTGLWIILSYSTFRTAKKLSKKEYNTQWLHVFWFFLWLAQFCSLYFFANALKWNMAIVVTIESFSILIPIILSVIFYKEEMTKKKAFVIFLSIVSVILFI